MAHQIIARGDAEFFFEQFGASRTNTFEVFYVVGAQ
jgi:hypothetical protein